MTVTRVTAGATARPVVRMGAQEPTPATRQLLRLMCTGATDRAIARELDVSLRTLNRRIARLQSLLGVQSRFQLGVLAAELQWLAIRGEGAGEQRI
ncbi:regulatory protein, luxR family [Lentzea fradiae]|uniref:Regulatory protein, luxR family n=1 Tax=Lentzea fradiae TaxID=200378 RepID=A0A1G7KPP0_9PSEU|nr:helix-turn-helix transcriptional regulator [Lentzea fradiae]SDF39101.1 regulatory protein, luxR family [Lentzea fradiae]